MNVQEQVRALLRAAPAVGEDMAVDMIVAAVEADVVRRRSERAAINGKRGADVRDERLRVARTKGKHTDEQWHALAAECGWRCARCQGDAPVERDHITPIYQGGSDGIDNIQPLCAHCNARKGPDRTNWVARRRLEAPPKLASGQLEAPLPVPAVVAVVSGSGSESESDPEDSESDPDYCAELEAFPVVGKGSHEWRATNDTVGELRKAFPAVDVLAECRQAKAWLVTNEPKRKTGKGMPRFLFNWVASSVQRGKAVPAKTNGHAPKPTGPQLCEWHKDYKTWRKPSKFPKPLTCEECKEIAAANNHRKGEPTSIGALMGVDT